MYVIVIRMKMPTSDVLDKIDMSYVTEKVSDDDGFKKYIILKSGVEHYRLLSWIGGCFSNNSIIDVGSFKGFSGCALSYNQSNTVYSFDITNSIVLNPIPNNLNFIIGNIEDYKDLIIKSPFIFYDTVHDGITEHRFITWLKYINYKGIIVFDDIYLNDQMKEFWYKLNFKKEDITSIGHWSGTGMVWM